MVEGIIFLIIVACGIIFLIYEDIKNKILFLENKIATLRRENVHLKKWLSDEEDTNIRLEKKVRMKEQDEKSNYL